MGNHHASRTWKGGNPYFNTEPPEQGTSFAGDNVQALIFSFRNYGKVCVIGAGESQMPRMEIVSLARKSQLL